MLLFNTPVVDISPLAHLPRLELLRFDDAPVVDVPALADLEDLGELSLAGSGTSDGSGDAHEQTAPLRESAEAQSCSGSSPDVRKAMNG